MSLSIDSDLSESVAHVAPGSVAKNEFPGAYLAFGLLADQRWRFRLVQAGDTVLFKRLA